MEDQFQRQAEALKGQQPGNGTGLGQPFSDPGETHREAQQHTPDTEHHQPHRDGLDPVTRDQAGDERKPEDDSASDPQSTENRIAPFGPGAAPDPAEKSRQHGTANEEEGEDRSRGSGAEHRVTFVVGPFRRQARVELPFVKWLVGSRRRAS